MTDALSIRWSVGAGGNAAHRLPATTGVRADRADSAWPYRARGTGLAGPGCRFARCSLRRLGAAVGDHVADHGDPVFAGLDRTGLPTIAQRRRHSRAFRSGGGLFWTWPRPAVVRAL